MIITKKHLPRRTFLRSAMGAMVAMPFLDAMVPALSAQARSSGSMGWARMSSHSGTRM